MFSPAPSTPGWHTAELCSRMAAVLTTESHKPARPRAEDNCDIVTAPAHSRDQGLAVYSVMDTVNSNSKPVNRWFKLALRASPLSHFEPSVWNCSRDNCTAPTSSASPPSIHNQSLPLSRSQSNSFYSESGVGIQRVDKYYSQYHIIMGLSLGPRPGEGQIDQCLEIWNTSCYYYNY